MSNSEIIETIKGLAGIEEELHTFTKWKELGYRVKKGEKTLLKESLWKAVTKVNKDGEKETKLFLTPAALFSESQVVKIEQ